MSDSTPRTDWDLNTFVWVNEKKLPGFGQLLASWLSVHRNYCASVPPEHSWESEYTERPQIGFLSNAAVLIGGIAREEWRTEKMAGDGKGYGRNDLWLRLSPPSSEKDYHIEAKYVRLDLGLSYTVSNLATKIIEIFSEAQKAAKRLNPKNGEIVAVSFNTLKFEDKNTEALESKMREFLLRIQEQNRETNNLDAIAAIWLGAEDFQRSRIDREKIKAGWKNYQVGIILLASRIK